MSKIDDLITFKNPVSGEKGKVTNIKTIWQMVLFVAVSLGVVGAGKALYELFRQKTVKATGGNMGGISELWGGN